MADLNNAEINVNVAAVDPQPENDTINNENWCCTKIQKIKCGFTWAIQNYKAAYDMKHTVLKSPTFSATSDSCKWYVKLYPKHDEDENYMGLYLEAISTEEVNKYSEVNGELKFSIINSQGQETNTKKKDFSLDDEDINAGFENFIEDTYLFDSENGLLPQDKLTIYCEILTTKQEDMVHVSGLCSFTPSEIHDCDPLKEFGKLVNNQEYSDITIHVNGKEYFAHKSILAGRSRVFAAMLQHDMKENQQNRIDIQDIDGAVFLEVLRYIYTGKVNNLEAMAFELLRVADKYDLQELKLACEKILKSKLSRDTVVKTLIFADTHNVENLKARTIEYIRVNSIDVLNTMGSEGWNELTSRPNLMKDVLTAYMKN